MKIDQLFKLAMIFLLVFGSIYWQIYRYKECRDFGHSMGYCIGAIVR